MTTIVSGPALSARPQEIELLEDKLRIPRPGLAVLPRSRVAGLIDAAVTRRVTLMTGPPGAGKTVALAQWATARPASRRPAWVTLDQADADPGRVLALRHRRAVPGRRDGRGRSGRPGPPAGMAAAEIPQWISARRCGQAADPVLLILDDVHALAGGESLAGLDELIRHEPAGLRLVLAGRSAPGLALSRLRLAGELADIGAADLACTTEETAAYFGMLGRPLSPADRDQIFSADRGLAGRAAADRPGGAAGPGGPLPPGRSGRPGRARRRRRGRLPSGRAARPAPGEVRNFMLRTCLTSTVPADLARDLTGETGAARLLEQLSRTPGWSSQSPPRPGEYRYHPMLRDVLAADLRRELPDEVAELQRPRRPLVRRQGRGAPGRPGGRRGRRLGVRPAAAAGRGPGGDAVTGRARPGGGAGRGAARPAGRRAGTRPRGGAAAAGSGRATPTGRCRIWRRLSLSWPAGRPGGQPGQGRGRPLAGGPAGALPVDRAAARARLAGCGVGAGQPARTPTRAGSASTARSARCGWRLGFAALREFDSQLARSALLHAGAQLSAGGLLPLRERGKSWEAARLRAVRRPGRRDQARGQCGRRAARP